MLSRRHIPIDRRTAAGLLLAGCCLAVLMIVGGTGVSIATPSNASAQADGGAGTFGVAESTTDATAASLTSQVAARNSEPPLEDEYVEPAPEEGDPYFEAAAADGRWISYVNPRDEYRRPYEGDGSGKLCVTLLNEEGDVIVGESVPDTTVTIPTDESIDWHSSADPIRVELPLTDHYERPLDSDQFGTDPDLPQGDGYMDAHCVEFHGLPENETVEYGPAETEGEYADWIDVVGYVQKQSTWDSDVDPLAVAESHDETGGWTYRPEASHGQAVAVLQLDPPADAYESDGDGDDEDGETDDENDGGDGDGSDDGDDSGDTDDGDEGDGSNDEETDRENDEGDGEDGETNDEDETGADGDNDGSDGDDEDADSENDEDGDGETDGNDSEGDGENDGGDDEDDGERNDGDAERDGGDAAGESDGSEDEEGTVVEDGTDDKGTGDEDRTNDEGETDREDETADNEDETGGDDETDDGTDDKTDASDRDAPGEQTDTDGPPDDDLSDELPGFGVVAALVALTIVVARLRR